MNQQNPRAFPIWIFLLTIMGGFFDQSALAQSSPASFSYFEHPQAQEWLKQQTNQDTALVMRYSHILKALSRDDSVLEKISRPAEKAKPWYEYRKIFEDAKRLEDGVRFYREHQSALLRAEQEFGVDAEIIVAILGVETRYGKVMGKTAVLQSLATLCFDYPPRSSFFCAQLTDSMRLLDRLSFELGLNPLEVQGSYAGAMGMAQFMPSSYLNDAIDYDGDGKVDLFHSPVDAIGSIANYLKNRGWERGGALIYPLSTKPKRAGFALDNKSHQPKHKALWWLAEEKEPYDAMLSAWLRKYGEHQVGTLALQSASNEEQYWFTMQNFYVITRYNTSPMYAMAVVNLAQNIKEQVQP
ncbi:MAG: lytic murein transglycosylase B [Cardiobacteriaceae bacterium]|nr:lytic murein transglycosylase B [Cardiobacteriaceae bacterium]